MVRSRYHFNAGMSKDAAVAKLVETMDLCPDASKGVKEYMVSKCWDCPRMLKTRADLLMKKLGI